MNSAQDIHICGICRAEFSDILEFLKHKKDCFIGGLANVVPQSGQLKIQEAVETTPEVQIPVLNSSSNYNLWTSESLSNNFQTFIGNHGESLSCSTTAQSDLHEKLILTNFAQYSSAEDTISLSVDHATDGLKYNAYPSPSSASQNFLQNTFTQSVPRSLPKEETSFQSGFRRQSHTDKISTDDIAVYIVSPKSFASSVIKPQVAQNLADNVIAKSHETSLHENISYTVANPNDELNGLKKAVYPMGKSVPVQASLPESSACIYTESSLLSSSATSTPCPEDLEVGQISASVLGQQPLEAPHNSGRTFVNDKSSLSTTTGDSPSNYANLQASVESVKCMVAAVEPLQGHSKTLLSYIRQNTASAPTVVGSSRESIKRRVSLEKRERLQGLSDDLLASFNNAEAAVQTASSSCRIQKSSCTSSVPSTFTNLPKATSFKAVFTSPSRSGHRLSPAQDLDLRSSDSAEVSKQISETSAHFKLTHVSPSNKRAMVYKNISAAVKPQRLSGNSGQGKKFLLKPDPQKYITKGVGRQIIFDTSCAKSLTSSVQSKATSQSSLMWDRNNGSNKRNLPKEEPSNVSVGSVKEGNVMLKSPSKTITSSYHTQWYVCTNNLVRTPDTVTYTNTNITTVTPALRQQIPTVICPSISTESSQSNQIDPSRTSQVNSSDRGNTLHNQDTIIVYKNGDANFVIVPENVHNRLPIEERQSVPSHHQPILKKKVIPLSLADQSVEKMALMNDLGQGQQLQYEQTQTACHNAVENNHTSKNTSASIGPNTICNISSQNQQHVTNSALPVVYVKTSQVSNSISYTVPSVVYATTNLAPTKLINNAGSSPIPSKSGVTKEPCIIRPKNILHKRNTLTGKPATQSQPQYEINGSTQQGEGNKKDRLFVCKFDKCRYSSSLYKDFRRHYRTHTGERPYQCQQCGKTFTRSDKLRIHQRAHDGTKPFQCNFCDYKALESGSLKKHLRIHSDERPYKCQICPYASRNSSHLVVHLRTHTGDAPFVCSECGAQFRIGTDLKRHLRTHTGEKPYKCDLCDYKCAHKGNLKSHMRINHSKDDEVSCDQCDFSSSSRKLLKEHAKTHDPSRMFKCQQCPLKFPSARALRAHLCTHDPVKPYQCSFCPYACKRSGNLKKHVQSQHMDKLQKAPGKQKGKKRASSEAGPLPANHSQAKVRVGSDKPLEYLKQHKCPQCGRGFVRLDSLHSHLNQHKREEGQNQRTRLGDTKQRNSPDLALFSSSSEPCPDHTAKDTSASRATTYPPTLLRQGMKHIAAAASKLFEESYASTKQTSKMESSVNDGNALRLMEEQNINLTTVQAVKVPHSFSDSIDESSKVKDLGKSVCVPSSIKYQQLPWEHSSYTLSLQPDGNSNCDNHMDNPSLALNSGVSPSHSGTHSDALCKPNRTLPKTVSDLVVNQPKKSQKIKLASNNVQEMTSKKQRSHTTPNVICHPNPGMAIDHWLENKQQQQQHQPVHINVQQSQTTTDISHVELDVTGQPFIFSQQGEDVTSQETSYNFQLVPQLLTPSQQLVRQIILPPAQVQPATHIQIVLPGATVPGQTNSETIGLPSTPQQILLQDCGTNQVEVLTLPYAQLPLASTPGQNIKVFQTVTSTGIISVEPEQVQRHTKILGQGSQTGNGTVADGSVKT